MSTISHAVEVLEVAEAEASSRDTQVRAQLAREVLEAPVQPHTLLWLQRQLRLSVSRARVHAPAGEPDIDA